MSDDEITRQLPLCFVAMPFGVKPRPEHGGDVNFDRVFDEIIKPAIIEADMEPLRADAEQMGGIIHTAMFERLVLSEYLVADLTDANANVFYELGVRHAVRPHTSVLIAAEDSRLPFDIAPARVRPYSLSGPVPDQVERDRKVLANALIAARDSTTDSPVFQLLDGFGPPDIERLRTDSFRDRVKYSKDLRQRLRTARSAEEPVAALRQIQQQLGKIEDVELGIAVDLLLSYRDVSDHQAMVSLIRSMPVVAQRTPLVREQLGFAQNRLGDRDAAQATLTDLIDERGPSSETLGLLGRVHKDRWSEANEAGRVLEAKGHLRRAIETYLQGFEADWRDAYPGINALTLMVIQGEDDPRIEQIGPVVVYSAQRRIAAGAPDYWDYATLVEAAVLANDQKTAELALQDALARIDASWQPQTTLNNLQMIIESRSNRGEVLPWYRDIEIELDRATRNGVDAQDS